MDALKLAQDSDTKWYFRAGLKPPCRPQPSRYSERKQRDVRLLLFCQRITLKSRRCVSLLEQPDSSVTPFACAEAIGMVIGTEAYQFIAR